MSKPDNNNETHIIGLDFNNLGDDFGGTIHSVSTSHDLPIIQELSGPHDKIKEVLSKRKNGLKVLAQSWTKGRIDLAIKDLIKIKDLGIVTDFFNSAFMSNEYNKDYLKLDDSVSLLPLVEKLVSSKHESVFRCGIKMVCMFFDMYSNSIRQVKKQGKAEGKTMENYNTFIKFFDNIPKIDTIKKRNLDQDKNLNALLQEMKEFVEDCSK